MNRRTTFGRLGALASLPFVTVASRAQSAAPKAEELRHTFDKAQGAIYLWEWNGSAWVGAGYSQRAVDYARKAPAFDLNKTAVLVGESWEWLSHMVTLAAK